MIHPRKCVDEGLDPSCCLNEIDSHLFAEVIELSQHKRTYIGVRGEESWMRGIEEKSVEEKGEEYEGEDY